MFFLHFDNILYFVFFRILPTIGWLGQPPASAGQRVAPDPALSSLYCPLLLTIHRGLNKYWLNRLTILRLSSLLVNNCSAQTRTGNPEELNWFLPLIKPLRRTRSLWDLVQTQVWSEQVWLDTTFISQGSRSWGKLAVETWRVKTELIIIKILYIIIITTSILNLGFKTIAPKILALIKMHK
jgi:hypothetical protein